MCVYACVYVHVCVFVCVCVLCRVYQCRGCGGGAYHGLTTISCINGHGRCDDQSDLVGKGSCDQQKRGDHVIGREGGGDHVIGREGGIM